MTILRKYFFEINFTAFIKGFSGLLTFLIFMVPIQKNFIKKRSIKNLKYKNFYDYWFSL